VSLVRPFEAADAEAVASLFQRMLRKLRAPAPAALTAYIRDFYLETPERGDGIASLVHVDDTGRISGFVGVHALPMILDGRPLRAAVCGSLMADGRDRDPMAGARLLKAFVDGPQDLSFSETANAVSTRLWTRLRGVVLPQYSLDWVRVIRPAGFAIELAAGRAGSLRLLKPAAAAFDGLLRRSLKPGDRRWAVARESEPAKAARASEIDGADFASLLEPLTQQFALRPAWSDMPLDKMLADAAARPDLGDLVFSRVETPNGAVTGAFAYHARAGRIGRVLQVLARPGQAGAVLDSLVDDAARRGLCGLRGRTQPALLEAMLTRKLAFVPVASSVVHARDAGILHALKTQQAFLNGLAGENWSRLIGGRFD
jgi:hypothetical protein